VDDLSLSPEEVLAHLEETAKRDRKHAAPWPVIASLLHRVEIEGLYRQKIAWHGQPYETAEEYADIELEMPRSQFFATRRLGNLIERDRLQPWEKLTRSQAVQISRLAGLDDVNPWIQKALSMPYSKFRLEVERALRPGEEIFVRFSFFGPESFVPFWDDVLIDGLRMVKEDQNADPALIEDPGIRFRCVEAMVHVARDANHMLRALSAALDASLGQLSKLGYSQAADAIANDVIEITRSVVKEGKRIRGRRRVRADAPRNSGSANSAGIEQAPNADGAAESRRVKTHTFDADGAASAETEQLETEADGA
jgi:hypothetical protein